MLSESGCRTRYPGDCTNACPTMAPFAPERGQMHSPNISSEAAAKSIRTIDRAKQFDIHWKREIRFVSNESRVLK
jgi:hypothetical protein